MKQNPLLHDLKYNLLQDRAAAVRENVHRLNNAYIDGRISEATFIRLCRKECKFYYPASIFISDERIQKHMIPYE